MNEYLIDVFNYYNAENKFLNLDNIQAFTLNYAIQKLLELYKEEKEKNVLLNKLYDDACICLTNTVEKSKIETILNMLKDEGYWYFLEERDLNRTIEIIENLLK